jgi:hypothetical protein
MSVGIDVMSNELARPPSASASTFPNAMSVWVFDAFSKTGPNARQGGHQAAQKSRRTMPSETTYSKVSMVICRVAMS